ncbi:MAG: glutamate-1-semialdehyde 2,1-aminomutase, partial [Dehalococcoidia bacterium]|nr:glutamate-1-semialdehyde 2,1-aminomutase [Dehalococcoidia bacterium]
MKNARSKQLFDRAQQFLPGGVNSPVRSFAAVGGGPLFIKAGKGSYLYDEDGNRFVDYMMSWGPLILGHAHPQVVAAVIEAARDGTSFGAPTARETELARLVTSALPSVKMVRFVSSGTEAVMSALRLARAFTGRASVVKFAGCYHGHSDGLLVKGGSGLATLGIPSSPGVPSSFTGETLIANYNHLDEVEKLFRQRGEEIAALIVEPVAANMGVVHPLPGFLEGLRNITRQHGSLLVFDEVITGFRVGYSGAQGLYGIDPDITCLGKIIGGGLPVGAYGGRREIMEMMAPSGPVYQAGTLSGNPLAMAAGIATLKLLAVPGVYETLEENSDMLSLGLEQAAHETLVPHFISRLGSLLTVFFTASPVSDYDQAAACDAESFQKFFRGMLERGVYLPPSQYEALFVSLAHSKEDINLTI